MRCPYFGLVVHDRFRATPGFTLYSPNATHETYLLGMRGEILHQWSNHPLVPGDIPIYGYIYDVKSGKLIEVPAATAAGRAR